jgi:hypothetical protein
MWATATRVRRCAGGPGFWGKGDQGWHYDLLFIAMNFVIFVLLK